ncbi:MAG: hypothetical protein Q4G50_06975 [Corynebacterium sp.]|uniref:Rv1476 family membrane protein n=1 Tax=Corynebacterium sp. TaxID=1720 RepID=UPI0026E0D195|nr:DUF6676 family protein [Corynebacterium sp.]MDO5669729.1 hypothetical protein [Corynebacterium sp.]
MIPEGVDIDDLARQIDEDSVAFGSFVPAEKMGELEPGLIDAASHAESSGFGSLGVVVLEHTPAHTPDLRDIAQDVLVATEVETVIVRAPGSGAIVSDVHSRAEIETAQYPFLADGDVVGGVHRFIDDVNGWSLNWVGILVVVLLLVAVAAALTAWNARRVAPSRLSA